MKKFITNLFLIVMFSGCASQETLKAPPSEPGDTLVGTEQIDTSREELVMRGSRENMDQLDTAAFISSMKGPKVAYYDPEFLKGCLDTLYTDDKELYSFCFEFILSFIEYSNLGYGDEYNEELSSVILESTDNTHLLSAGFIDDLGIIDTVGISTWAQYISLQFSSEEKQQYKVDLKRQYAELSVQQKNSIDLIIDQIK